MAGNFNSFAAGKKVYSNGSHAPHRGRNNPRGYIKRSLRKRMHRSKSRSGLAKSAMKRRGLAARNKLLNRRANVRPGLVKKPPGKRPIPRSKPVPKGTPRPPVGTGTTRPGAPNTGGFDPNGPQPPGSSIPGAATSGRDPVTGAATPANPYVEINSNGQLDLPYNAQYSWDMLDMTQGMNKSLLELQQGQQEEASQYQQGGRDLDYQFGEVQRDTLNTDAGKGTAYSSIHGQNLGRNATEYNNARSDLDVGHNQAVQNFGSSRMQIQNAFNEALRQNALANAESQAENAGSLGYGKGAAKPTPIRKAAAKKVSAKRKPQAKKVFKHNQRKKQAMSVKKAGAYYRAHGGSFKGFKGPMKAKVIAKKRAAARQKKRTK